MSDSDRLHALAAIVKNMRAAQRDFWAKGRTTVVECKRLEAACDLWLETNGFSEQRTLFEASGTAAATSRK
jgi:hypothetical protein